MRNSPLPQLAVMVLAVSLINWSCSKINWKDPDHKPRDSKCDVAEYLKPDYDLFNLGFPYLFKKKYDQSGKKVEEIDCTFDNLTEPEEMRHFVLLVQQKGQRVYLLDKINPNDTVMKANLNSKGRVEYYETNGSLDWTNGTTHTFASFFYKNNRLELLKYGSSGSQGDFTSEDSLHYDPQGNLLAYRSNHYVYNYTRPVAAQFYIDENMEGSTNGYYLLQYLDFFPEVTNPPNLRVYGSISFYGRDYDNQTFDAEGKLTGYRFGREGTRQTTIDWNCK